MIKFYMIKYGTHTHTHILHYMAQILFYMKSWNIDLRWKIKINLQLTYINIYMIYYDV